MFLPPYRTMAMVLRHAMDANRVSSSGARRTTQTAGVEFSRLLRLCYAVGIAHQYLGMVPYSPANTRYKDLGINCVS